MSDDAGQFSATLSRGYETVVIADPVIGWAHYLVDGDGWELQVIKREIGHVDGWICRVLHGATVSVHESGRFNVSAPSPDVARAHVRDTAAKATAARLDHAREYLRKRYQGEVKTAGDPWIVESIVVEIVADLLDEISELEHGAGDSRPDWDCDCDE